MIIRRKKIGKMYGQKGAINSEHKGEGKNRLLIEPAIAISQKEKLHLKAQISYNSGKVYFVFTPAAMFRKHISCLI